MRAPTEVWYAARVDLKRRLRPFAGRVAFQQRGKTRGGLHFAASLVVLAAVGLPFDSAQAQIDANRFCRDRNPDGYYDCAWLPANTGVVDFTIPGPIKSVTMATEDEVIEQYKGIIAANAGSRLSGNPRNDRRVPDAMARMGNGPLTNWERAGFWAFIRAEAGFAYGVLAGTQCVPASIGTYLYQIRYVGCAAGWGTSSTPTSPVTVCVFGSHPARSVPSATRSHSSTRTRRSARPTWGRQLGTPLRSSGPTTRSAAMELARARALSPGPTSVGTGGTTRWKSRANQRRHRGNRHAA